MATYPAHGVHFRQRHLTRWLLVTIVVVTALAVGCGASSNRHRVTSEAMSTKSPPTFLFSESSVGGFRRPASHYFSDAVHYFGRAPCEDKGFLHHAVLTWSKLGLRVADTGHVASRSCGVDQPIFVLLATKDRRWHTERGLHIGDSLARLHRLYPHAKKRPRGGWHLCTGLAVNIVNGRVQTLILGGESVSEMPGGEKVTETVDDWLPGGIYADAVYS